MALQSFGSDADYTGVVRLRGLPYDAAPSDIVLFFSGIPIDESSVVSVKSAHPGACRVSVSTTPMLAAACVAAVVHAHVADVAGTWAGSRAVGEAFVVFKSDADATAALKRDKERMGSRWIEVTAATKVPVATPLGSLADADCVRVAVIVVAFKPFP